MTSRGAPDTTDAQVADIYERIRRLKKARARKAEEGKGGVFYIQIAAADASEHSKARADFICGGYQQHRIDHEVVQMVVDAFSLPEVQSDGGGTILLSAGTFWFGDSVTIRHNDGSSGPGAKIAILGLGAYTEVTSGTITAATTINDARDVAHSDSATIACAFAKDRVRIENIHFVGPGKTPAAGVSYAVDGASADITACSAEDYNTGFAASGAGAFWQRCAVRDCSVGYHLAGTNGGHILSCYAQTDTGILVASGGGDLGHSIVEGCVIQSTGTGINFTGQDAIIVGNSVHASRDVAGAAPKGIVIAGTKGVITGNRVRASHDSVNGAVGIHVTTDGADNIVQDNNVVAGYGAATPTADGIRVEGDKTSVQGNTIRRGTTLNVDDRLRYGVNILASADRTICTDNDLHLSGQTAAYNDAGTLTTGNCGVPVVRSGTGVLVAGVLTVNTAMVTANSRIFLTSQVDGGTPGFLRVTARVAGTSFTVTSSNAADTSTFAWEIIEP